MVTLMRATIGPHQWPHGPTSCKLSEAKVSHTHGDPWDAYTEFTKMGTFTSAATPTRLADSRIELLKREATSFKPETSPTLWWRTLSLTFICNTVRDFKLRRGSRKLPHTPCKSKRRRCKLRNPPTCRMSGIVATLTQRSNAVSCVELNSDMSSVQRGGAPVLLKRRKFRSLCSRLKQPRV